MEIIQDFIEFLRKAGAPHFLTIGIVIIVLYLLFSGFKKGLKKKGKNGPSDDAPGN